MDQTNRKGIAIAAGVLALAAAGAGTWWYLSQPAPPPARPAALPPVAAVKPAPPPEPAIRHPVEAQAAAELPALADSDKYIEQALLELLDRKSVLGMLQLDGFARRVVATVDNLARHHAAPRLWPVNPTPGRFAVKPDGTAATDQNLRYAPFVLMVESADLDRTHQLYLRLYPLLQKAYEELGYPGQYFNDRLVAVIDTLLATPVPAAPLKFRLTEVKGEQKPVRPWVRYEFEDPALEAMLPGQKILLRMGAVNQRRLQARLAAFRKKVAKGG